jgi:hypothetical protein
MNPYSGHKFSVNSEINNTEDALLRLHACSQNDKKFIFTPSTLQTFPKNHPLVKEL